MATTRLNDNMRDSILEALVQHAFGARFEAIEKARQQLAAEVYRDVYIQNLDKMKAMPAGFLPEAESIYVKFDDEMTSVDWGENRRIADDHSAYKAVAKVYGPRDDLSKCFFALKKQKSALESEKSKARGNAKAILKDCTTLAKLLRVWPEVEPFTREFAPAKVNLPAIPRPIVNKQFGLPVGGAL
jgi:hypothetical protein